MNINYLKVSFQKGLLLLLSALLYIQTYPANDYPLLAWVALVPWFMALEKNAWKLNILLSFLFSGIICLIYPWTSFYDAAYLVSQEIFLASALTFVHLFSYMLPFIIVGAFYHVLKPYALLHTFFIASLFTVLSLGIPTLFTYNLATALYNYPLLLQVLDISGLSLLLWFIVVINMSLKNMLLLLWHQNFQKELLTNTMVITATLAFIISYGYWHLNIKTTEESNKQITIATIQPNMGHAKLHHMVMIRDNKKNEPYSHIELSRKALATNPNINLIVWPEGGVSVDCQNKAILNKLSSFTQEIGTALMYQCHEIIDGIYYNQSRYMGVTGKLENIYNKQNLIPFFEYIPKIVQNTFIAKKFEGERFYKQGEQNNLFYNDKVSIIPAICYDAHSHELIRKGLKRNGDLLVIQSNDLIFKKSNIGLFDTATNIITAVSFRVPVVKSSNSGYGVFLSSKGEVIENSLTPPNQRYISVHTIAFKKTSSLYREYRDWFYWLSCIFVSYLMIKRIIF